jgi:IclR family acetate operon transcriptional repressor
MVMRLKEKKKQYQVPSVVRALKILEVLSVKPEGMTISELSQELQLPLSSTSTLLNTLHSLEYLVRENKIFSLSSRLFHIGNRALQHIDITWVLQRHLRALVDEVGITAQAAILEEDEAVIIETMNPTSTSLIKINTFVGRKPKLTCSSLGKTLVAYQKKPDRERIIRYIDYPKLTRNTITDPGKFSEALGEVRNQGYAIDDEEEEPGIRCVGAPVFGVNNEITAAVSLCGTTSQLRISNLASLIKQVQTTARIISTQLGWFEAQEQVTD